MKNEEIVAVRAAQLQLTSFDARLRQKGLTYLGPEIEVLDDSSASYSSELRVKIYRNRVLDDLLEFHIFRKGVALVSADDVTKWFEEQLDLLIR